MSDESQPPPLRLKPRSRPADSPPDAPADAGRPPSDAKAGGPSPAETGEAAPRLRLKPKLSLPVEEPGPTPAPVESPVGDASTIPPTPSAPPAPEAPAADAPDTSALLRPKLRLATQPEQNAPAAQPPAAQAAPPPALVPEPPPPAPPAVIADPPGEVGSESKLPEASNDVPAAGAPPPLVPTVDPSKFPPPPIKKSTPSVAGAGESLARPPGMRAPATTPPESRPLFKLALLVLTVAAVGVLAAGLYFGYSTFIAGGDAPDSPAATADAGQANVPTPAPAAVKKSEPANEAKSPVGGIAARVRQTTDAAAARVAEIPLDEPAPAAPKSPTAPQDHPVASSSATPEAPAKVDPPPAPRAAEPGPAFQLWVSEARVSGVRAGAESRAFINGRLVRQGEMVDPRLGIRFEGVDTSQNILLFRDPTGAVIGKKF